MIGTVDLMLCFPRKVILEGNIYLLTQYLQHLVGKADIKCVFFGN